MAVPDVESRRKEDRPHRRRSVLVNPMYKFSPPGSRWGGQQLTFTQLRQLAQLSPTMQAIIHLRQEQVASFMRRPRHKGDRGFEIVRADDPGSDNQRDKRMSEKVFKFLMSTGDDYRWGRKDLPDWAKSTTRDAYIIGAGTTELVYSEDGRLSELWDIDAATIEMNWSERYIPTTRYGKNLDQPVRYVQVVDGQVVTEYAQDELVYMQMSPVSDLSNGLYPISYAQSAQDWMAAEVLALQYNSNYFDHGSVPPGILAIVGNASEETMDTLNTMWKTDVKGIVGQHQPVALALESTAQGGSQSINWIPMKQSNRDMEMGGFLDKISNKIASICLVDPLELSQRMAAATGGVSSSENTDSKIDLSRDKGLVPLLELFENTINKEFMPRIAPGYIFRFTGISAEDEASKTKLLNEQLTQGGLTFREWRRGQGLDDEPPNASPETLAWLDAPGNPNAQKIWMAQTGIGMPTAMNDPGQEPALGGPQGLIQGGKQDDAEAKQQAAIEKSWQKLLLEA